MNWEKRQTTVFYPCQLIKKIRKTRPATESVTTRLSITRIKRLQTEKLAQVERMRCFPDEESIIIKDPDLDGSIEIIIEEGLNNFLKAG